MIYCPECGLEIDAGNFNVATDLAYCSECERNFPYHELVGKEPPAVPTNPWMAHPLHIKEFCNGTSEIVRYQKRVWAIGLFFLFFTFFWNGFVSFAVWKALCSSNWELFLFLIPFIFAGIVTFLIMLYFLFGAVRMQIGMDSCVFIHGVGPIGLRRRFPLAEIEHVRVIHEERYRQNNCPRYGWSVEVELKDGQKRKLRLGDDRPAAEYMAEKLRKR